MKPEDFAALGKKAQNTHTDTTPFAVIENKQLVVAGDANNTKVKKHDYTIKFRFPKSELEEKPDDAIEVGDFYSFAVEYKSVSIAPRDDLKIVDAIYRLQPLIHNLTENGDVQPKSEAELLHIFAQAGDDVHLAIYTIVAEFLGINDWQAQYMKSFSVINAFNDILDNHPEVFNEAETFFD